MPDDASGYSNRGYAHRKLGNYAAAVDDYTAAITRCGSTVRLHNNRAYCLAKLGSYQVRDCGPMGRPLARRHAGDLC